jgi:hypothetical protein
MQISFDAVNWLAISVSVIASFGLGAVWYSPLLFGKQWVKAHGFSDEQIAEMQQSAVPAYVSSIVGYIIMALVFTVIKTQIGLTQIEDGLMLALLIYIGFVMTTGLINAMFSGKSRGAFLIDTGYQLATILITGAIVTIWV